MGTRTEKEVCEAGVVVKAIALICSLHVGPVFSVVVVVLSTSDPSRKLLDLKQTHCGSDTKKIAKDEYSSEEISLLKKSLRRSRLVFGMNHLSTSASHHSV